MGRFRWRWIATIVRFEYDYRFFYDFEELASRLDLCLVGHLVGPIAHNLSDQKA